jgi:hypothetical protein
VVKIDNLNDANNIKIIDSIIKDTGNYKLNSILMKRKFSTFDGIETIQFHVNINHFGYHDYCRKTESKILLYSGSKTHEELMQNMKEYVERKENYILNL